MVRTKSTMLDLGSSAPNFSLLNTNLDTNEAQQVSLAELSDAKALVVMFICNHCPFVIHLADAIGEFATEYQEKGAAVVGISSNDVQNYPQDGPEKMSEEAKVRQYTFPYLFDADQSVAKAYRAACTPDFFLFDQSQKLVYRGQFDDSRPKTDIPVTGVDLRTQSTKSLRIIQLQSIRSLVSDAI